MSFLKELKEKRKSYREMVDFCCDSLILADYYVKNLNNRNIFIEDCLESGKIFEYYCDGEEISRQEAETLEFENVEEKFIDFYQFYIIDSQGARRFKEYTNETIFYIEEDDLYIFAVSHFGTSWNGVPANWKEED